MKIMCYRMFVKLYKLVRQKRTHIFQHRLNCFIIPCSFPLGTVIPSSSMAKERAHKAAKTRAENAERERQENERLARETEGK